MRPMTPISGKLMVSGYSIGISGMVCLNQDSRMPH